MTPGQARAARALQNLRASATLRVLAEELFVTWRSSGENERLQLITRLRRFLEKRSDEGTRYFEAFYVSVGNGTIECWRLTHAGSEALERYEETE